MSEPNAPQKPPRAPVGTKGPQPCAIACTEDELAAYFKARGEPAFRATQVREFIYRKGIESWDGVTNLSKDWRTRLSQELPLYEMQPVSRTEGDDANKWLWRAQDGALVESVQIRVPGRLTSCLSSQVGCAMGCVFCATGMSGFERNLKAHEIVEQYLQMWGRSKEHSSHIVFMGMGEPLHNYDEVISAIRTLNAPPPKGCGIGARRITISTVAIVPGIKRLATEKLQIELAISLHAPDDVTRAKLIPVAKRFLIRDIMDAVKDFSRQTGRIVTYEYVLLAGINDSLDQASELAALLQGTPCKVNLIPYNEVEGSPYKRPSVEHQERIKAILESAGLMTTIRFSKGRTVDAACGQLRRRTADGEWIVRKSSTSA